MRKISDDTAVVPPSLSWNKGQMRLYYDLAARDDVVFAYYWTTSDNLPGYMATETRKKREWKDKWRVKPLLEQLAAPVPKKYKDRGWYSCSKYALHATTDPWFWRNEICWLVERRRQNDIKIELRLWVVALYNSSFCDFKYASPKRTIIGEVPETEFVARASLCDEYSDSYRKSSF